MKQLKNENKKDWLHICLCIISYCLCIGLIVDNLISQNINGQLDYKPQIENKYKYDNSKYGIRIDIPGLTWQKAEEIGTGNIVAFLTTLTRSGGSYGESSAANIIHVVGIFQKDLSPIIGNYNFSVDDYSNLKLSYLKFFPLDIYRLDNFTFDNKQIGYKLEYKYQSVWNGVQAWTVKNNIAYDLIYLHNQNITNNSMGNYYNRIIDMMKSFEIIN